MDKFLLPFRLFCRGIFIVAFSFMAAAAFAGPGLEQEFHFPAGSPGPLLVRDGYAYVLNNWTRGDGVLVFDVRDPAKPRFVSGVQGKGYLNAGVFLDDILYATGGFSLMLFDVSAPESIRMRRNILLGFPYQDARRMALAENRLYLGGQAGGLRVFNVTDPAAPLLEAWYPEYDNIAGIAAQGDIIAVSFQGSRTALAQVKDFSVIERSCFKSRSAAMLMGQALIEVGARKVWIQDIGKPDEPLPKTNFPADTILGFSAPSELAVLATNKAVEIWSMSDPFNPSLQRRVVLPEDLDFVQAAFWNNRLHVLDRAMVNLCVMDIAGEKAKVLGKASIHRNEGVFELGENHAFQAFAEHQNLMILTMPLNKPGVIHYQSQLRLGPVAASNSVMVADVFRAAAIQRVNDFLLAGDGVVDIADPLNPKIIKPMNRTAAAITVDANTACLAQGDLLTLLDISKLPELSVLSEYRAEDGERHYTDAVIRNGMICAMNAAKANPRIEMLDVRDPTRPKCVGKCDVPPGIVCAWAGSCVYAPGRNPDTGMALMTVVDVANPSKPRVAASLPDLLQSSCYRIREHEGKLYYTDSMVGIQMADLSDPLKPVWIRAFTGNREGNFSYTDFEIKDNHLYGQCYSHIDVWNLASE